MAVEPEDFMFFGGDSTDITETSICLLGIVPNSGDFYLVGDTFLRGFYSVHRMDDMSLGLVPHAGSNKAPLDDSGVRPENELSVPFNVAGFARNIIVFAIFYGGWFGGLYVGLDPSNSQFKNAKSVLNKAKKYKKSTKKT